MLWYLAKSILPEYEVVVILSPLQLYFQHDVVVPLKNKGLRAKRHTSELNAEHSHFILLDNITDLHESMALRYKIEERLLTPIGRGKRYRKMINMSDPNLSMIKYSYYRHCIFIYLAPFYLGIIKNWKKIWYEEILVLPQFSFYLHSCLNQGVFSYWQTWKMPQLSYIIILT